NTIDYINKYIFFFQAEDGIRDRNVTGVQTCALPIYMRWFTNLFKARDKPQNYSFGSNYSFIFGNSSSGKSVNEFTAMQMTAVYSCVRILAEAVAGLPLHLYKYTDT